MPVILMMLLALVLISCSDDRGLSSESPQKTSINLRMNFSQLYHSNSISMQIKGSAYGEGIVRDGITVVIYDGTKSEQLYKGALSDDSVAQRTVININTKSDGQILLYLLNNRGQEIYSKRVLAKISVLDSIANIAKVDSFNIVRIPYLGMNNCNYDNAFYTETFPDSVYARAAFVWDDSSQTWEAKVKPRTRLYMFLTCLDELSESEIEFEGSIVTNYSFGGIDSNFVNKF